MIFIESVFNHREIHDKRYHKSVNNLKVALRSDVAKFPVSSKLAIVMASDYERSPLLVLLGQY
jgi:hypothetical protein